MAEDVLTVCCKGCGKYFLQLRYWQRFHDKACKNKYYRKEAQLGRDLLKQKRAEAELKDL